MTDNSTNCTSAMSNSTQVSDQSALLLLKVITYVVGPLYSALFAIGLVGNCWVISVVVGIFRTLRSGVAHQNVFIYILSLSIVDLLVVSTIPFVVVKTIYNRWVFGEFLCRLFYGIESINKILSSFILTAVSWDRYVAVCHPFWSVAHSTKVVLSIITASAFVVALLLLPIHINARVLVYPQYGNVSVCTDNLSFPLRRAFMIYIFMLGYVTPAVLMTLFYFFVLRRLYGHSRSIGSARTQVPVRKVAVSTMLVVGFYYFFWTPYWLSQFILYVPNWPRGTFGGPFFVLMSFLIMALPYASSAFNWILYAFLNKQLRQSYGTAQQLKRLTSRRLSNQSSVGNSRANHLDDRVNDCAEMQLLRKSKR